MTEEKPIVPFKRAVNMSRVNAVVDKCLEKLRAHYDTSPEGAEFNTFVQDMFGQFPPGVRYDAFFASVMTMVGSQLTRAAIRDAAWRLAANMDRLKRGKPVPVWTRQTELEWAAIKLVRSQAARTAKGGFGHNFDYRVLSGSPAGMRFSVFWRTEYARFVAKSVGFTQASKKYPFAEACELVGMQLYVLLDPGRSYDDRPGFYHFHVPSSCASANRRVLKMRVRETPCPEGFALADVPCHKCPFGYDKCPAGCHPVTYVAKSCPRCRSDDTWFDPAGGEACLACEERALFTRNGVNP